MSAILRPTFARRFGGAIILLAVCTVLAACGAGADEPSLTAGQAAELQRSISAARGGAEQDDPAAVRAALERFRSDVRRLAANGTLSEDRAQALLSGVEQAQRRVEVDIRPAASPGDVPADGRGGRRNEERPADDKDDKADKDDKEDKDEKQDEDDKEDDDQKGDDDD